MRRRLKLSQNERPGMLGVSSRESIIDYRVCLSQNAGGVRTGVSAHAPDEMT